MTAPYVTLRTAGNVIGAARGGYTVLGFYKAAHLPPGSHPDDVASLLDRGFIEEVDLTWPSPRRSI